MKPSKVFVPMLKHPSLLAGLRFDYVDWFKPRYVMEVSSLVLVQLFALVLGLIYPLHGFSSQNAARAARL